MVICDMCSILTFKYLIRNNTFAAMLLSHSLVCLHYQVLLTFYMVNDNFCQLKIHLSFFSDKLRVYYIRFKILISFLHDYNPHLFKKTYSHLYSELQQVYMKQRTIHVRKRWMNRTQKGIDFISELFELQSQQSHCCTNKIAFYLWLLL